MRPTIFGVLLLLVLSPGVGHADDIDTETWDRMHISGVRSGHAHTQTKTVAVDGVTRIETHGTSEVKIKRGPTTIEIVSSTVTWEKPDGTLLRIEALSKMSSVETKAVYTFDAGTLTVETAQMGQTRKVESKIEQDLVGPAFAERETAKLAGTTDKTVTYRTYQPEYQTSTRITITSKGLEKTEIHDGSTVEATRLDTAVASIPMMKPTTWIDASGKTVKVSMKMAGMQFDTYRVKSQAEARGTGEVAKDSPDLFQRSLIIENDPIPVPRRLDRAWVTVRVRGDDGKLPAIHALGYDVTRTDDGLVVRADRVVPPSGKQGLRPLASVPDDLDDAMAPSSMIQSDADEIVKIAKEVVGDTTNAWEAAQKLERWVFENMTQKNFSVAFGSALEACRTREGDCTEHAVLLAALCRAAGIPARVVMGVEYVYGIWGGHAWNDVWIDGAWYQLDATNGFGFVDPLHLPMAHMTMKEGGASEFVQLIGSLGHLDVDATRVVRDGRTIAVRDSARLVTADNGRFRDEIWGLQFYAPTGYELQLPGKRSGMSTRMATLRGKTTDGTPVRIEVGAMDAPGASLAAAMQMMKWTSADQTTIDGRPGRTRTETREGRSRIQTIVIEDGALYRFTLTHAAGEAERKAFDALLQSVDLDVR